MTAASRGHRAVLESLIAAPSIDLFARNLQNETVYDIAAEKGDLIACELIERHERARWSDTHPDGDSRNLSFCILTLDPYESGNLHNVTLSIIIENARLNSRTHHPDPQSLISNIDPPRFTPCRRQDITLPQSSNPSLKWIWVSKWTVSSEQGVDGWRFAQRWDATENEWVSDSSSISPISRSGLVARRRWFRSMKKVPIGHNYVEYADSSESEGIEPPRRLTEVEGSRAGPNNVRVRPQPSRTNSMSARLVGLVAGTSKGK